MKLRIRESEDKIQIRKIKFPSSEAEKYIKRDMKDSEAEYLSELKKHSIGEIIVNADTDDLIGRVFVYKTKYPGFIYNVEVSPKYRGHGFGKMLTDDAVKKLNGIDLTVKKTNYRAIQLYKNYGFEIIGDGNDESEYYMKLKDKINESCKDVGTAREFLGKVRELANKYDANYFIVTDGASSINNNGNPAVENARSAHMEWELENGFDPNEDWNE